MSEFFDELDAQGVVVRSGIALGMYDNLAAGHTWVPHASPAPVPPPPPTKTTPLTYIERFTAVEQLSITTASMQSAQLRLWYDKLMAAQEVVFADPRLSAGMDALVAAGLITQARSEEILPLSVRVAPA